MATTRKIDVNDLAIGMYIAELDRPWLDTPFLFQGFYIRDDAEINELREHCKNVFVSCDSLPQGFTPSSPPKSLARAKAENDPGTPVRSAASVRDREKAGKQGRAKRTSVVVYTETTTLKEEYGTAAGVQKKATATVQQVMQNLRNSGELEIGTIESAVTPMVDSVLRNPAALSCLIRMQKKDDYLYQHSLASTVWAAILGRQLGLARTDINLVSLGAMLLDVGKTQIPKEILTKPGRLTDKEMALMRTHVERGLEILDKAGDADPKVIDMIAHHHERHNGTGYPEGISGNSIPVFGRIAGIVDTYDAMITPRPYAKLLSSYDALRMIRKLSDVEFQAEIVNQFTRAIGAFPTGTLVELNTGEIAIVTRQNQFRRLRPEVMVIMGGDGISLEDFRVIDLNEDVSTEATTQSLWIERGLPPGAHGIDPTEYYID